MNLRYPNITGKTPLEQISQLRSFLYQLVDQLNVGESGGLTIVQQNGATGAQTPGGTAQVSPQGSTPMSTFNQVKSLIIKSADIVNAYYEEINRRLEGVYVAESEFGTYQEQISQEIKETAGGIERAFIDIQRIEGELQQTIGTSANIRSGLLFTVGEETLEPELGQTLPDGSKVFGVEIGQSTTVDDVEVFHKFARFTAYGMTLYDNNEKLSAYITDSKMNIPNAVIKNSLTRGGYQETVKADGSIVEKWVKESEQTVEGIGG